MTYWALVCLNFEHQIGSKETCGPELKQVSDDNQMRAMPFNGFYFQSPFPALINNLFTLSQMYDVTVMPLDQSYSSRRLVAMAYTTYECIYVVHRYLFLNALRISYN